MGSGGGLPPSLPHSHSDHSHIWQACPVAPSLGHHTCFFLNLTYKGRTIFRTFSCFWGFIGRKTATTGGVIVLPTSPPLSVSHTGRRLVLPYTTTHPRMSRELPTWVHQGTTSFTPNVASSSSYDNHTKKSRNTATNT